MRKTIAAILFGASLLSAQSTGTPPTRTPPTPAQIAQRRVDGLTRFLNLTTSQQAQALGIFTASATTDAAIQTSMKTARDSLKTAIQGNDANSINATSNTIATLTGQLTASNATAEAAFLQTLLPDQLMKYNQRPGFGGGFGPGGFHGHRR